MMPISSARPEVPVEVLGRILPRPDQGARPAEEEMAEMRLERQAKALGEEIGMSNLMAQAAPAARDADAAAPSRLAPVEAALAEEAATRVIIRVPYPVSAAAGHSLMVPIVSENIPAERVSLFQPATHPRHPLASLRLTNDGANGLPPGILTLYETTAAFGTAFIGDARLAAFPAGDERLVSFAVDQKMTVDSEVRQSERIIAAKIADGILELRVSERARTRYTIEGAAKEPRVVLIEHPVRPDWKIVAPDAASVETTGEQYRIRQELEAGARVVLDVIQERPVFRHHELLELGDDQLRFLFQARELPAGVRAALTEMSEQRAAIGERGITALRRWRRISPTSCRTRRGCATISGRCPSRATCTGAI